MSDDVAAVMAEAMYSAGMHPRFRLLGDEATHFANVGLAALTEAGYRIVPDDDVAEDAVIGAYQKELTKDGYAIVKLPEGVAVAHGARLVFVNRRTSWFAIEATP